MVVVEESAEQLFKSVRSVYVALAAYVNQVGKEVGKKVLKGGIKTGSFRVGMSGAGTSGASVGGQKSIAKRVVSAVK